jgi:hypothetical protein
MNNHRTPSLIPGHATAALANIALLSAIPVLAYCGGIFLTGDVGGPLNLVLVPVANFAVAGASSTLLFAASLLRDRRTGPPSSPPASPRTAFLAAGVLTIACIFVGLFVASLRALSTIAAESEIGDPLPLHFIRFAILGGFPLVASIPSYMLFDRVFRRASGSPP